MIIDQSHEKWIVRSSSAAIVCAAGYLVYALNAPGSPSGRSVPGLVFGSAAFAIFIFECLLSSRKKYPASPLGRVHSWLRAHVWLGLFSFLLVLFHSGLKWGTGLSALLMWIFAIVTVSGIVGVVVQHWIPRRLTALVTRETIYEQIPEVITSLRIEADERVEFVTADVGITEEAREIVRAGGRKFYFDPAQRKSAGEKVEAERQRRKEVPQIEVDSPARDALKLRYLQEIRPYLAARPASGSERLFGDAPALHAYFDRLRTLTPVSVHEVLSDLEDICDERRQLRIQQKLHLWLHTWLYIHVPLSFSLLVLTTVHAVLALRY
jgi:hypothetical protein